MDVKKSHFAPWMNAILCHGRVQQFDVTFPALFRSLGVEKYIPFVRCSTARDTHCWEEDRKIACGICHHASRPEHAATAPEEAFRSAPRLTSTRVTCSQVRTRSCSLAFYQDCTAKLDLSATISTRISGRFMTTWSAQSIWWRA